MPRTRTTTATQPPRTAKLPRTVRRPRTAALSLAMLGAAFGSATMTGTVAVATAAPGSTSPEALARARALADEGRALHDRGEYGRAVAAFQTAYVLAPSPALLFNLGQAYRLKRDCDNAALMYRAFLRTRPEPQLQEVARAHLASVEQCMSPAASEKPALIAGAATSVVASAAGTRSAGEREPGRGLRRGGAITAIGGGVLLGLAGYFAYRAGDANDQVEQRYGSGVKWRELEALDARGQRDDTVATGLAFTGGVAVITGGVLYLIGRRQGERAERQPALSLAPTRGGGAVRLAWTF
jgi:hypothetical protein